MQNTPCEVRFSSHVYTLETIKRAAYRFTGQLPFNFIPENDFIVCEITPVSTIHSVISLLRMSDAGSGGARNPHILPVCSGSCAPTSPACVTLATTYDAMYKAASFDAADAEIAINEFKNEVLDQDLRRTIADETATVRNVILAHVFSKTGLQSVE